MVVDRARVAVGAPAVRVELVGAARLVVARVDGARVVVVAIHRGANARTRRLAHIAHRAFVRVVAGDGLAVLRFDRRVDAEHAGLRVARVDRAGVPVVALDRLAFTGAGRRALVRLRAQVPVVAVGARRLTRARAAVDAAVATTIAMAVARRGVDGAGDALVSAT